MTETFIDRACQTGSASVVVRKGADPVVEWFDEGGPRAIETMSVTKLVVAVVCGAAMAGEGPEVLDAPVSRWIEEWADDERGAITLAQLLGHTSGLEALPTDEILAHPSTADLALRSCPVHPPGRGWAYNNSAFNLVGLVVKRHAGRRLQEVGADRVFEPLGFGEWSWRTDPAGDALCHFGLRAHAADVVKVGELLPLDGRDDVLPRWWVEPMRARSLSCYAQRAWVRAEITPQIVAQWRAGGVDADLVERLEPLTGRRVDAGELVGAVQEALGADLGRFGAQTMGAGLLRWEQEAGPVVGYGHDGDLGQWLVVLPGPAAVAVRQREDPTSGSMWATFPGDADEVAA